MSANLPDYSCEPVVAVCGFSGSGKTTLLEAVIPQLIAHGLRVAAVKHDAHGLSLDVEGKDSDRLFRAGADVVVAGPGEVAFRRHAGEEHDLSRTLDLLLQNHDVVLVEGHKTTPLAKVWLNGAGRKLLPGDVGGVLRCLSREEDCVGLLESLVRDRIEEAHSSRARLGGVLVGGRSRRFGSPKQMTAIDGRIMVERVATVVGAHTERLLLLGDGEVPETMAEVARVIDAPETSGPLAGILSALRWSRRSTWIVAACDLAKITNEALEWILQQRRPGRWAVVPRVDDRWVEPLLAVYEPQALSVLENMACRGETSLQHLRDQPAVATPRVPDELSDAWVNVNSPEDVEALKV